MVVALYGSTEAALHGPQPKRQHNDAHTLVDDLTFFLEAASVVA